LSDPTKIQKPFNSSIARKVAKISPRRIRRYVEGKFSQRDEARRRIKRFLHTKTAPELAGTVFRVLGVLTP